MATYRIAKKILIPVGAVLAAPIVVPALQAQDENRGKKIKPKDLPIYENPEDLIDYEVIDKSQTALVKGIRTVRISITEQFESLTDVRERFIQLIHTGTEHTRNTLEYLNDESNVLPRAAAITLGGLGGLLFSIRGGIFKKIIYSSTGFAAMASVCYPQQAAQISQDAYKIGKYYAIIGYNNLYEAAGLGDVIPSKPTSKVSMDTIAEQVSDVHYYGFRLQSNNPPDDPPERSFTNHGKTAEERSDGEDSEASAPTLDRNIIDSLIDPVTGTYIGHPCDPDFPEDWEEHLHSEDCTCKEECEDSKQSFKSIDTVVLPFKHGKFCDDDSDKNMLYIDDLIDPSTTEHREEPTSSTIDFAMIDKFIEPSCNCPEEIPKQPEKPKKRMHFPRLWGGEKSHDEFRCDSEEVLNETCTSHWSSEEYEEDTEDYSTENNCDTREFLHKGNSLDSCSEYNHTKKENYCKRESCDELQQNNYDSCNDKSFENVTESDSEIQIAFTSETPCNHSQNFYVGEGISDSLLNESPDSELQQFEYMADECCEDNEYEGFEMYEDAAEVCSTQTYSEEFEDACDDDLAFVDVSSDSNFFEDVCEYIGDAGESCSADCDDQFAKPDKSYLQLFLPSVKSASISKTNVSESTAVESGSVQDDVMDDTEDEVEELEYDDYDDSMYEFDEDRFTEEEQLQFKKLTEETFEKYTETTFDDDTSEEPFDSTDMMREQIS